MNRNIRRGVWSCIVGLSVLMAGPAQAEPVYVIGPGLGLSGLEFMAPHYFARFAGQLRLDNGLPDASDDFYGYCVDATRARLALQDMTARPLSELTNNGYSTNVQAHAGERVAWLLNQYGTDEWLSTDGNYRAAALQIAIWEVLYDPYGSYDITGGTFKLLHASLNPLLVSYTRSYFTGLGDSRSEAVWYDTGAGQDFARPLSVPEPGSTVMLLASGLAGLGWFARRRPRL